MKNLKENRVSRGLKLSRISFQWGYVQLEYNINANDVDYKNLKPLKEEGMYRFTAFSGKANLTRFLLNL